MGIDVNYANGQAARLRAQIAELNSQLAEQQAALETKPPGPRRRFQHGGHL